MRRTAGRTRIGQAHRRRRRDSAPESALLFLAAAFAAVFAQPARAGFLAVLALAAFIDRPGIAARQAAIRLKFRARLHRPVAPVIGLLSRSCRLAVERLARLFGS